MDLCILVSTTCALASWPILDFELSIHQPFIANLYESFNAETDRPPMIPPPRYPSFTEYPPIDHSRRHISPALFPPCTPARHVHWHTLTEGNSMPHTLWDVKAAPARRCCDGSA
eukprot:351017-Chlamydomonas_euryale.AAC.4